MTVETATFGAVPEIKRYPLISDSVYDAIRRMIVSGEFAPGERLRQQALARALGVDQPTVRHALSVLASEGLVVPTAHKGFTTTILSEDDLTDFYEMSAALEGLAVEVAATRITPEQLAKMRALLPQMEPGVTGESRSLAPTIEFLRTAYEASGRRLLNQAIQKTLSVERSQSIARHMTDEELAACGRLVHTYGVELIQALEAKDGKRARGAVAGLLKEYVILVQRVMYRAQTLGV